MPRARSAGTVSGAVHAPEGSRTAIRTPFAVAAASVANPFGSETSTGHSLTGPRFSGAAATLPSARTVESSTPPAVQRTSSPGRPVARTHAAAPATGRNGSSANGAAAAVLASASVSAAASSAGFNRAPARPSCRSCASP